MMVLLRIALGLAWSRSLEHRWRQLSVGASALVFMLLMLAAASVVTMAMRQNERAAGRTGQVATSRAATDLFAMQRADSFEGKQISIVWIEPVSPDTDPVLPPGFVTIPAQGQAVVSPALEALAAQQPQLAARYPNRLVLGWQGVRGGSELIAYIRPQAGRQLGGEESAIEVRDGSITGEPPVYRIGGYGSPDDTIPFLVGDPGPPMAPIAWGVVAVLALPAIIVLAVGVGSGSPIRDHRFAVLRAIGMGKRGLSTLAIAETITLAMPGFILGLVLWAVIGPRLTAVPLVGYAVVPGDLTVSWWRLGLALLVSVGVTTALAIPVVTRVTRRQSDQPRPTSRRRFLRKLRFVPLAIACFSFVLGRLDGGYRAADFYLVGIVIATAAIPVVIPEVLWPVGAQLARARSAARSIAGRAMQWDPARAAMPFVGGAALLVLALSGMGYVAAQRDVDNPEVPLGAVEAVIIEWRDPRPGDLARISDAVRARLAVPFSGHSHSGAGDEDQGQPKEPVSVGAQCTDLVAYFPDTTCASGSPFTLPSKTSDQLIGILSIVSHEPINAVRLVPAFEMTTPDSAFLIGDEPLDAFAERVRTAASATVPAPTVETTLWGGSQESPVVPWIISGAIVAAAGLALACLLSLVDRFLAANRHHQLLINLGITSRQLATLGAWMFAAPYFAVCVVSFAAGLAICALLVLPGTSLPWAAAGATAAIALVVGVVGTTCVAVLGVRSALKERE